MEEVNFWRPHGDRAFRTLQRGEPFFFKLRGSSQRAIVGFGLFERFEGLPAWQAWTYFGEMNGAADFDSMIDRIARLRGEDNRTVRAGDFQIGCIMLSAPVFFPPQDWVLPPSDWARTGSSKARAMRWTRERAAGSSRSALNVRSAPVLERRARR